MGLLAKSPLAAVRRKLAALGSAGVALPTALFGLVAVGVLTAGVWVIVDLDAKASVNRERAARALLVAEAGLSHALAVIRANLRDTTMTRLLRGSDGVALTADDGLLTGYGLDTSLQIPATGKAIAGGTYRVQFVDDPAENNLTAVDFVTDVNSRILARCRGVTTDSASADVEGVIGLVPYPAFATQGDLSLKGNPKFSGPCGGLHANQVVTAQGNPVVDGTVSASDTVKVADCTFHDSGGNCVTPLHHQPPVDIPDLTVAQMCTNPNHYTLRADGFIDQYVGGAVFETRDARTVEQWGWAWSGTGAVTWTMAGSTGTNGTYCVEGNVAVTGIPGTDANPWSTSIFATGSVKISGSVKITSNDPSGALIVAEGDVSMSGNSGSSSAKNYQGLIYAGSQCELNGNPTITGQLLCKNNPNPPGSTNVVTQSAMNPDQTGTMVGNPEITFSCGGMLSKRIVLSWYQRMGT